LLKGLLYLILLAALTGLVRQWPFLWEIGVLGAIGGAYWIFFREPPSEEA